MIKHNNQWGTVCDDGLESDNYKSDRAVRSAESACSTLGFEGGTITMYSYSGSEKIWFENVNCGSSTTNFLNCPHQGWENHDCSHSEDLLLTCT